MTVSKHCLELLRNSERTMKRTAVALLPVIGKYVIHENESTIVKDWIVQCVKTDRNNNVTQK
jgi:hypothetical protein